MKSNAALWFPSDPEGSVSVAALVYDSPSTTGSSAAKADPGIPPTLSTYAAVEQLVATAGLKLTPWQLTLMASMYDLGKTQPQPPYFYVAAPRCY